MKNTPFVILLILTLIAEAAACFIMVTKIQDIRTDPVKVNECMYSVKDNYGDPSKYDTQLDYVVIGNDGGLVYKTRDGLSETVNDAIKTRGLILDLEVGGEVIGKVIFDYNMGEQIEGIRMNIIILFTIVAVIQIVIIVIWYIYLKRTLITPFSKLNDFAVRVAGGNLDLPLEMDKGHVFGAFTESFDLMRHELRKARLAEKKASDDKKEMVAKLSHDIKTPVASIKSTSEIGMELTKEERTKEMFGVINSKTDQIKLLVDNLFTSSVQDITEIEVNPGMQPSDFIAGLIKNSDYMGRTGSFSIPECNVYFDKLRLQQVFDNIFMNSYKYADTGISVNSEISGDYLIIKIADKGPGVKEEEIPLLTEKYRRGSNASDKDGAGLGLYLTNYFMEKMDGQLSLKNLEPGFEAAVYLRLV
ncbi:HAMP domain-containing sensor histidine kinase [Butyrivibrio sp. AE2032]|uniref:HAMP domain-containing sensor histidine kinase n=1 Tax=Butyrivibrio sp. AE2032 TaxID=1458463 RepID=UPI000558F323|nr:HAMP domain-containing sensor histidine kinase [Butyrivibrio sp. AE2032]